MVSIAGNAARLRVKVSSSLTVKGRLFGGMSEWFMVAVLKTVERGDPLRGFESYFLRNSKPWLSWFQVAYFLRQQILEN